MILAFKPQFKDKILNETKIHTIREDPKRRWKAKNKIHFATGVRTKNYNCFKEAECVSVQNIYMEYIGNNDIEIRVESHFLSDSEKIEFAKNDGFETWQEFFDWFYPLILQTEINWLICKLIHWTDKQY